MTAVHSHLEYGFSESSGSRKAGVQGLKEALSKAQLIPEEVQLLLFDLSPQDMTLDFFDGCKGHALAFQNPVF